MFVVIGGENMQTVYYDRWEFLQAYNLIHSNPIMSKKLFEEYIQKYPSDYSAQNYYVYLLNFLNYQIYRSLL